MKGIKPGGNMLERILNDKNFLNTFWEKLDDKKTERECQRKLVETLRQLYPENFVKFYGDIPTANNATGYDLEIKTPTHNFLIEAKKIENVKLRKSQLAVAMEIYGFEFISFNIVVFDVINKEILLFTKLKDFKEWEKRK